MLKKALFILTALTAVSCADKPSSLTEHNHSPAPLEKFTELDLSDVELEPSSIIVDDVATENADPAPVPAPAPEPSQKPIQTQPAPEPSVEPTKPTPKPLPTVVIAPSIEPSVPARTQVPAPVPIPALIPEPAPVLEKPEKDVAIPKLETPPPVVQVPKKTEKSEVKDQAVGSPQNGRLQNAANLLEYQIKNPKASFKISDKAVSLKKYFGTDELADMIIEISDYFVEKINPNRKIIVTQMSYQNGGKTTTSASHQNGVDADIRYIPLNPEENYRIDLNTLNRSNVSRNLNVEVLFNLFLEATKSGYVNVFFVHDLVKESLCKFAEVKGHLNPGNLNKEVVDMLSHVWIEKLHSTHFHLRVKCDPKTQPGCTNNPELLIRSKGEVVSGCNFKTSK